MEYIKKNIDAVYGGGLAVGIGLLGKMALKKEVLPVSNIKQIITTFALVTAAGIGANEIKLKYPQT